MWTFILLMFFTMLFMGVTIGITPLVSRRSTPFGVSVPKQFLKDDFIVRLVKRYAIINIAISFFLALPLLLIPFYLEENKVDMVISIYLIIIIFLFMIVSFLIYLKYRKELMKWKKTLPIDEVSIKKKIVIDSNYHEKLKMTPSSAFVLWQLVIIIVTVVISLMNYDRIPDQIPINFDSNFQANHYVEKSFLTVLSFPLLQVLFIPIFYFAHYSFIKSRQKLSPLAPVISSEKSRRYRQAWSKFSFLIAISTQLLISSLFLSSVLIDEKYFWLQIIVVALYLLLTIGSTFYLSIKYGQGGEKLKLSESEDEDSQYYQDPEEDEKWIAGMFYYNPDDAAVFVEKRYGIGTTINLARWQGWAFVLGILLLTLIMIIWSFLLE
ncbi:DUF1648 domain-containing protein [Jeotgalibaca ciconiae]|uniref:DUF1648 domain-containing protein n=1 Tax=Jeotgalibaca ciconiae TaxID=2496265 RepID=A0A3Q9BIP2_9LACT|nr:DUF5808 domain-containing protein [Jeotgalibaca ciconiae]AZP03266.1 DUF1648 domain-containing protein [Jeotgalibaca ciconiae]